MNFLKISKFLVFALSLVLFYSCKEEVPTPEDKATIKLAQHATYGDILVNGEGKTLYFFSKDVAGASLCTGGCLTNWPAYAVTDFEVGAGLSGADFAVLDHPDGGKIVSYKGWPLYFYAGDAAEGDVNGEGLGGNWFVAKPDYDVMIAELEIGGQTTRYLTDIAGMALYTFSNDDPDVSNCTDGCLAKWPKFSADNIVAPSTINVASFGEFTRPEGSQQTAFTQKPLYYYADDAKAGDVNGEGVGGVWFLLTEDQYK